MALVRAAKAAFTSEIRCLGSNELVKLPISRAAAPRLKKFLVLNLARQACVGDYNFFADYRRGRFAPWTWAAMAL